MFSAEFDGLNHWSFIDLYNRNQDVYRTIYQEVYRIIKEKIPSDPSIDALENSVYGLIIYNGLFRHHCDSKRSYNPNFNAQCAKKFAKYIVFNFYKR